MKTTKYREFRISGKAIDEEQILKVLIENSEIDNPTDFKKMAKTLWNCQFEKELSKNNEEETIIDILADQCPEFFVEVEIIEIENPEAIILIQEEREKSDKAIGEIIAKAASMILVDENFTLHFEYKPDGRIAIKTDNPPSIDEAHSIIGKLFDIKKTSDQLENFSLWTLGMMVDEFQTFYGDDFDPTTICEATKRNWNTISTSLGTYRMFWGRKRNLSFTHHKEITYAKIEDDEKEGILDLSEKFEMSVGEQRKIVSFVRRTKDIGSLLKCETKAEVEKIIEGRSDTRTFVFRLRERWFVHHGVLEEIPATAHPIIDTKTKRIRENGEMVGIEEWETPEIQETTHETPIEAEVVDIV